MLNGELNLKDLPYYKERAVNPKKHTVSCKVPLEVKEELEKHFELKYPESEGALSDGIRDLVYYYLNNTCLEKRSFNYYCYIAIPKSNITSGLNEYTTIIPIFTGKPIKNDYLLDKDFHEFSNIDTVLKEWYKFFDFDMMEDGSIKQLIISNAPEGYLGFDILDIEDGTVNIDEEINFEDYNYYRFKINNYLDKLNNGSYGEYTDIEYNLSKVVLHKGYVFLNEYGIDGGVGIYFSFFFQNNDMIMDKVTIENEHKIMDIESDNRGVWINERFYKGNGINPVTSYKDFEKKILTKRINEYEKRIKELEDKKY